MQQRQGDLSMPWQSSAVQTFEQLYDTYKPSITRYLLGMCGDVVLAEELAQEVFVRAAAKLLQFRGESSVSTWLFRIARNTYLSWVRRQRDAEINTEEFNSLPDTGMRGDPEAQLLRAEQQATIRHAMTLLPERQRTMLLLRDLQELSYAEIAAILEISLSAVKVNIHRARLSFREIYDKLEGNDHE